MFQARQELARVEREVAAGRDPFPEAIVVPAPDTSVGLCSSSADAIKNRNARDDRSRMKRYLVPEFGKKVEQLTHLPESSSGPLGMADVATADEIDDHLADVRGVVGHPLEVLDEEDRREPPVHCGRLAGHVRLDLGDQLC